MAASTRTLYHTRLKYLVRQGQLSSHILQRIPRSNLARWKQEDPAKYEAFGLDKQFSNDYETICHFAHDSSAQRVYAAYVRIVKMVLNIAHSLPAFHSSLRAQRKQVMGLLERVKKVIGLKRALLFFNISLPTYRNWSLQSATQCFESLTASCNRVFHNQLSRLEVLKIKEFLTSSQFQYWPVSSIALYSLRKNILPLSLNTWYKYVHKLGLVRPKPDSRRKKKTLGIRADRPHQLWHADITTFVTADRVRHFIYLVADNFSRKILSWLIAPSVSAELRKTTILDALNKVSHPNTSITLITDGGPENNLKAFLASLDHPMDHQTALVDIHFSNSLIEAHNKVIKYNYLYRMTITDGAQLMKVLSMIVDDFNNRPHISLGGLSPNDAEQNMVLATAERKVYNRNHRCQQCTD